MIIRDRKGRPLSRSTRERAIGKARAASAKLRRPKGYEDTRHGPMRTR